MFRSEPIGCYHVMFTKENAWEVLEELGHLGIAELRSWTAPANTAPHRAFLGYLRDAQSLLEKLNLVEALLKAEGLAEEQPALGDAQKAALQHQIREKISQRGHALYYSEISDLVNGHITRIEESITARQSIVGKLNQSTECLNALEELREELPRDRPAAAQALGARLKLEYIAGVIDNSRLATFQRSLFRLTRGNAYSKYRPLKTGEDSPHVARSVMFLAFQSNEARYLLEKVRQLCDAMEVRRFAIPEDWAEVDLAYARAVQENVEARKIYTTTCQLLKSRLEFFTHCNGHLGIPLLVEMQLAASKAIYIFGEMEKLQLRDNIVSGTMWLPLSEQRFFFSALKTLQKKKEFDGFRCQRVDAPSVYNGGPSPTLFKTRDFFLPFQQIVDTYGIPRYQEANPGLFTAITFPFLFGLMFGDIGHGLGLLAFGLALVFRSRFFSEPLIKMRYLITLMGIFATFCGVIYNEFFSLPVILAPSCYPRQEAVSSCVYPIGIDYSWHAASNAVNFVNSFKMKLSIVVGVLHMTLGIVLKGANALFFRDWVLLFGEFLPQLCFFLATFGYMLACIVAKWLQNFTSNPNQAPSIISLFINLPFSVDYPLFGEAHTQLLLQRVLVFLATACVPVMLLTRPIAGHFKARRSPSEPRRYNEEDATPLIGKDAEQLDASHDLGEVFVHQAIETIEFLLGSISNTASYLRLWALSLAHSQLARVFFDMLLRPFLLGENNPLADGVLLVVFFPLFISVTIGVLMIMDVLECFLHALRLHWVEFQNKFYKGDGVAFSPFTFETR